MYLNNVRLCLNSFSSYRGFRSFSNYDFLPSVWEFQLYDLYKLFLDYFMIFFTVNTLFKTYSNIAFIIQIKNNLFEFCVSDLPFRKFLRDKEHRFFLTSLRELIRYDYTVYIDILYISKKKKKNFRTFSSRLTSRLIRFFKIHKKIQLWVFWSFCHPD